MFDLISQITSFPKIGADLSKYFKRKDNEKMLVTRINKKYDVVPNKRAYIISTIDNKGVQITTKILAVKIVCNIRPKKCTSEVTACAEQCVAGVQMKWALFQLNQLMEDAILV